MNETYESTGRQSDHEHRRLNDMSERELLERLFEMTCPSCDKDMIRQAAREASDERD